MAQTQGVPTELGTKKIGKLLTQYSVPAIIAMTASSIYNMVDSIFIGQGVGPLAISGLATTFPFMNLSAAFGAMIGMGGATILSVKLGQKDYDSAKYILGNTLTLNTIVGVLFGIISLIFLDPILYFFGASDATLPYARDFMQIILVGNAITHLYFGINNTLRASGHPMLSMYATILTVVINVILAPLFIYGFKWGIRGAALATMLAQTVTLIWQMKLLSNPHELLHLQRGIYKLRGVIVKDIVSVGLSPFLINVAACLIVILINKGLRLYSASPDAGDMNIAAYGITNRVTFIFIMIVMGLTQGMQPIAGYNFGAGLHERVGLTLKLTLVWATVITVVGFLICELIPQYTARAFTQDEGLVALSARGMRIVAAAYPLVGIQIVTSNFFLSVGKVKYSIFLSLTRQVLFLIPLLLILPLFFQDTGVWMSLPISATVASVIAIVMLRVQFNKWKESKQENGGGRTL